MWNIPFDMKWLLFCVCPCLWFCSCLPVMFTFLWLCGRECHWIYIYKCVVWSVHAVLMCTKGFQVDDDIKYAVNANEYSFEGDNSDKGVIVKPWWCYKRFYPCILLTFYWANNNLSIKWNTGQSDFKDLVYFILLKICCTMEEPTVVV